MSTGKVGAASLIQRSTVCSRGPWTLVVVSLNLSVVLQLLLWEAALPQPDVDRSAPPPVNTLHRTALASDAVELIETNGRQPQSEPIHLCRAGGGRQADRKKTKRIALPPQNKWKTRRNCGNV